VMHLFCEGVLAVSAWSVVFVLSGVGDFLAPRVCVCVCALWLWWFVGMLCGCVCVTCRDVFSSAVLHRAVLCRVHIRRGFSQFRCFFGMVVVPLVCKHVRCQ